MADLLKEWVDRQWDSEDPDTDIPRPECTSKGCTGATHYLPCPRFFHSAAGHLRSQRANLGACPVSIGTASTEQKRWLCLGAELASRSFMETESKVVDPWLAPGMRAGLGAPPPIVPPPPTMAPPSVQPTPPPPPPSQPAAHEEQDPNKETQETPPAGAPQRPHLEGAAPTGLPRSASAPSFTELAAGAAGQRASSAPAADGGGESPPKKARPAAGPAGAAPAAPALSTSLDRPELRGAVRRRVGGS